MNLFNVDISNKRKPKFRIGDVVQLTGSHIYSNYFIKESIIVNESKLDVDEYMYEVGNVNNPDETHIFEENDLIYSYHDKKWEEYVTETVENNLPAWRGELYNYYIENDYNEKHNNDTIPLAYMFHIIDAHTMANRFDDIIKIKGCKEKIKEVLEFMTDYTINNFKNKLKEKLISYDKLDTDIIHPGRLAKQSNTQFTEEEEAFIKIIDKYDPKDLYPFRMTSLQIMHAIKEAYANAYKVKGTKGQIGEDKRTGEHYAPNKGQRIYQGESQTYNMIIEFWFDIDMKVITSAYPIKIAGVKSKKKDKG